MTSTHDYRSTRLFFRLTFCVGQPGAESKCITSLLNLTNQSLVTVFCIRPTDVLFFISESCHTVIFWTLLEKIQHFIQIKIFFMVSNHLQQSHRLRQTFTSFMASYSQYLPGQCLVLPYSSSINFVKETFFKTTMEKPLSFTCSVKKERMHSWVRALKRNVINLFWFSPQTRQLQKRTVMVKCHMFVRSHLSESG